MMNMITLTRRALLGWNEPNVLPTKSGIYQRDYRDEWRSHAIPVLCKFQNGKWYCYGNTMKNAQSCETTSDCLAPWRELNQIEIETYYYKKPCSHHYVMDSEHPNHHCCQLCGKVKKDPS